MGFTGYYRRFIKNYASITQALTVLLKKNSFKWSVTAKLAFNQLKKAMTEAPVLGYQTLLKSLWLKLMQIELILVQCYVRMVSPWHI